jgi:hypothetical protein
MNFSPEEKLEILDHVFTLSTWREGDDPLLKELYCTADSSVYYEEDEEKWIFYLKTKKQKIRLDLIKEPSWDDLTG